MIIGHKKQREFFKEIKEGETIPHAFVFCGEEKIGKKLVAKEIAMALNCENKVKKPCGLCNSCIEIKKGLYKDISIIGLDKEIKISEVKDFVKNLSYKTHSSNYKIGIIDNAHLMTRDAQNSFLKILEEPNERTLFFLITKYPDFLLKTIISRVWKIKFFPVEKKEMEEYLEKRRIKKEDIEILIKLSSGRPGVLMDFLKDKEEIKKQNSTILEIEKVFSADIAYKLKYAKEITDKEETKEFFENWTNHFRKQIFLSLDSFSKLGNINKNLKILLDGKFQAENTNVNNKLLIENLLINLN